MEGWGLIVILLLAVVFCSVLAGVAGLVMWLSGRGKPG